MDVGQVKSGEDKDDTFVKMLQAKRGLTEPIANGIITEYPSVLRLVQAMRKDGPLLLQDLRVNETLPGCAQEADNE